jgi:hypothetical protein
MLPGPFRFRDPNERRPDTRKDDSMKPQTNTTDLQLRWLRLRRHLRSCNTSARALRDASRALLASSGGSVGIVLPARSRLCRGTGAPTVLLAA